MGKIKVYKEVVVKEVAVRAVAYVVEQACQPEQLFT
ncbi:MAG: hypothetical protein HW382_616 [Deltaproteobacteria bacterium]|nr:hypothetical protein [Deltaproteobacteria bacterium]